MKKSLPVILASALFFLFVFACKKSNSDTPVSDPTAITVANLSATYQITAATGTYAGLTIDIFDTLPACEKDNLYQLNADNSARLIDTGMVCDPSQSSSGTWALNTSTDSISVTGLGSNHIESFDGTKMVLKGAQLYGGVSFIATTTLMKK